MQCSSSSASNRHSAMLAYGSKNPCWNHVAILAIEARSGDNLAAGRMIRKGVCSIINPFCIVPRDPAFHFDIMDPYIARLGATPLGCSLGQFSLVSKGHNSLLSLHFCIMKTYMKQVELRVRVYSLYSIYIYTV